MTNVKKILASAFFAFAITLTLGGANAQAASASVTRVDGGEGGRIGTADQVAKSLFSTSQNVVLVNGFGYADAVSATPLAKQLNAPILLTAGGDTLESEVLDTIETLKATKIYIVGGTGVVSSSIEDSLKGNYQVERIAGTTDTTRMGTNAEVAKKVLSMSGQKSAMLVNGQDGYADALSVSSIAAQKGYPVLLASSTQVSDGVKNVISSNSLSVMAVGGDGVLPQSVVSSAGGSKITGNSADRFATNLAVLQYFQNNGGVDFTNIYVAAGGASSTQFADALVASAAAAKTGSPLVLSGAGADENAQMNAKNYILSNIKDGSKITIIGGDASVSSSVEEGLKNDDPFQIIDIN